MQNKTQAQIDALWATRPKPNPKRATAYALHKVREFEQQAREMIKKSVCVVIFAIAMSCVPLKKYKALEKDYQEVGDNLREVTAKIRLYEILLQDIKAKTDTTK